MRMLRRLWSIARSLTAGSRRDRDLRDELQSYLELREDELQRSGMPPKEAARRARLDLGGVAPVTELVRAGRAGAAVERTCWDVHYALRGLRRSPAFAVVAIGTLALGIGANLAVFAVVDAALFKPLPYAEAHRLIDITQIANRGTPFEISVIGMSWRQYDRWRAETRLFDASATYRQGQPRVALDGVSTPRPPHVGGVSAELLRLLRVPPLLGRWFTENDGDGGHGAILLAESFWRTSLGADRNVAGRSLAIDGRPHLVVGVMPETFLWGVANEYTIGWRPYREAEARAAGTTAGKTIFRLREGLTFADADRELDLAAERHLQEGLTKSLATVDLHRFDWRRAGGLGDTDIALLVLFGAAAIVVLVACANVANLVLARQWARHAEIAVRSALGASRGRIAAQFFAESLVLAGLGGIAAWWVLALGVELIPRFVPADLDLFEANPLELDSRVVAACLAMVLLATVCCSVPAAIWAKHRGAGGFGAGFKLTPDVPSGGRIRACLLASQIALTIVLLAGSSLLGSSFVRIATTDVGFNTDGLGYVSPSMPMPRDRYPTTTDVNDFFDALKVRIRLLPSVRDVVRADPPPGSLVIGHYLRQDADTAEDAWVIRAEPAFFRVAGVSAIEGRLFTESDATGAEPVALLDESSARLHWPGESAVGQQIRTHVLDAWITIVGVVGDVKLAGFHDSTPRPVVYRPSAQSSSWHLLFRTDGDMRTAALAVQDIARAVDPRLDPPEVGAVSNLYGRAYESPRFYAALMMMFAGLALVTAAVGLFGVLSFVVGRRRREIGIRMALGAPSGRVRALVVREALTPVIVGIAIGLVMALWLTRYLSSMLYQVTPGDPVSYLAALGTLAAVAALAAWLPARHASRIDPSIALRE